MSFSPTPDELSLAERILSAQKKRDVLDPDAAVDIFMKSGLSHEVLAEVWNMADEGPKGYLLTKDVALALRLIGWAQAGEKVSRELVERNGPLAVIKGFSAESSNSAKDIYPPIPAGSREKYKIIFDSAGPENSVLSNHKVVEVWNKSGLSEKALGQIWNLVNVDGRDYLDFGTFCLGMYFIQGLLDKHFTNLPETIPAHLSSEFKTETAPTFPVPHHFSNLSSPSYLSVDVRGRRPSSTLSPLQAATTPFLSSPRSPLPRSSSFANHSILSELEMKHWILHSSFAAYALQHFQSLDTLRRNYIENDTMVPFLQASGLSVQDLAKIWDLADASRTGRISRDGFTVAMFLVHRKLAGFDIPDVLPAMSPAPVTPRFDDSILTATPDPSSNQNKALPIIEEDAPTSPRSPSSPSQIQTLQAATATMRQENDALRSSLKGMSQALERQKTLTASRRHSSLDKDVAEISRLKVELQNRDALISRMKTLLDASENLGQENALLRVKVESLESQVEAAKADCQVQQIVAEEVTHEADELRRQVQELRDSATVPSAGGDEELQTLINEDLSRENGRLRNQVRELQDAISQLQAVSTELDARKETERGLVRENKRLKRQLREMEEANSARSALQTQVDELNGQNENLRRELETAREHARRSARRPVRQDSTDVPPPSYSEVAG